MPNCAAASRRQDRRRRSRSRIPSQGVQLATMQKLARYWAHGVRLAQGRSEAELPTRTSSPRSTGWTFISFTPVRNTRMRCRSSSRMDGPARSSSSSKIIEPLTDPTAHGGTAADAFHVVIPSMAGLRVFGQADTTGWDTDAHGTRLGRADEAPRLHALRGAGRRLGRARHRADGRAGTAGTARHPHQHGFRRAARSPEGAPVRQRAVRSLGRGKTCLRAACFFFTRGLSYAQQMATHPQCAVRDRGFAGRSRCLAARQPVVESRAHHERRRRAARRPHERRHPRQRHAVLADRHGAFPRLVCIGRTSCPSSRAWGSRSPSP